MARSSSAQLESLGEVFPSECPQVRLALRGIVHMYNDTIAIPSQSGCHETIDK
jgi:hypothetical protein